MRTLEKERVKRFQSAGEMDTTVEHLTEVEREVSKPRRPEAGYRLLASGQKELQTCGTGSPMCCILYSSNDS